MTKSITYVGWGGKPAHVPADFNLGHGHYRGAPAYGLRRAVWDAAFGYVSGFRKRAIVYYVITRSFSRVVCEIAMRLEGVEFSGRFGSVPLARRVPMEDDHV